MPPTKEQQIEEAAAREKSGSQTPPEPIADGTPQEPAEDTQRAESDPDRRPSRPTPRQDTKRNDIVARFRGNRGTEAKDDAEEILAFARQGLPPEMAEQREQVVETREEPVVEQRAEPPAKKHKLKVRGQEREVTTEELIALAQKNEAADQYLDEARGRLEEVNTRSRELEDRIRRVDALLEHNENSGRRPAPGAQHQDPQTETPPEASGDQPKEKLETTLAKDLVFGDPEEAGQKLKAYTESQAQKAAREEAERLRINDEHAKGSRFVREFQQQHSDIDADAEVLIKKRIFDAQHEDLVKLFAPHGYKPEQIPHDEKWLMEMHLKCRALGEPVRSVEQITQSSYDDWKEKHGRKTDQPPPADTTTTEAPPKPTVVVTDARRNRVLEVQQQPTRTSVPRQTNAEAVPDRTAKQKSVVANMIALRGKPRGRIAV